MQAKVVYKKANSNTEEKFYQNFECRRYEVNILLMFMKTKLEEEHIRVTPASDLCKRNSGDQSVLEVFLINHQNFSNLKPSQT